MSKYEIESPKLLHIIFLKNVYFISVHIQWLEQRKYFHSFLTIKGRKEGGRGLICKSGSNFFSGSTIRWQRNLFQRQVPLVFASTLGERCIHPSPVFRLDCHPAMQLNMSLVRMWITREMTGHVVGDQKHKNTTNDYHPSHSIIFVRIPLLFCYVFCFSV